MPKGNLAYNLTKTFEGASRGAQSVSGALGRQAQAKVEIADLDIRKSAAERAAALQPAKLRTAEAGATTAEAQARVDQMTAEEYTSSISQERRKNESAWNAKTMKLNYEILRDSVAADGAAVPDDLLTAKDRSAVTILEQSIARAASGQMSYQFVSELTSEGIDANDQVASVAYLTKRYAEKFQKDVEAGLMSIPDGILIEDAAMMAATAAYNSQVAPIAVGQAQDALGDQGPSFWEAVGAVLLPAAGPLGPQPKDRLAGAAKLGGPLGDALVAGIRVAGDAVERSYKENQRRASSGGGQQYVRPQDRPPPSQQMFSNEEKIRRVQSVAGAVDAGSVSALIDAVADRQ